MQAKKILRTALLVLACAVGVWLFAVFALPVLLPFFIGLAVSLLAEKPVIHRGRAFLRAYMRQRHLCRWKCRTSGPPCGQDPLPR